MKRILFLLATFLTLSLASAQTFTSDGINYNVTSVAAPYTVEVRSNSSYTGALTIPSSVVYNAVNYAVTSIRERAFDSSTELTSVTIPSSVISIGDKVFYGCTGLTSVTIPNSVTSIGDSAFANTALTSVTIPTSVTSLSSGIFSNCIGLTSVTIPDSVTTIGVNAFINCSGLTSVTIGNSVTSIGTNVFKSCFSLTSITIPNSVTSIGYGALIGCSGLTSVTIPNSVTSIGEDAFAYCSGLTSVICAIETPLAINASFFANVNQAACSLTVPTASVDAYKAALVWQDFNPINGDASVSTNEHKSESAVKLYPNPVHNTLFLELNNTSKNNVEIIDATGKLLLQKTVNNGTNSIDTSNLTTGIYFVKISSDRGSVTKKIIKK